MKYTYFASADQLNLIKIGRSRKPSLRVREMSFASPVPLRLLGFTAAHDERELHHRFRHLWCRAEWFYATRELTDFIASVTDADLSRPRSPREAQECSACLEPGHYRGHPSCRARLRLLAPTGTTG